MVAYLVVVKRVVVFGIWVVNAFQLSYSIESINVESVFLASPSVAYKTPQGTCN